MIEKHLNQVHKTQEALDLTIEKQRLAEHKTGEASWKKWGPYLSERQWGTVREDYSEEGDAWNYLPHDHARSRSYRWGEDGIAGFSDYHQRLCFSLALWNGKDEILKERLFGLANEDGNHGEDVKELYYYLDASPSHSYLKMLYKYPQNAFPYKQLTDTNKQRSKSDMEFEILDTDAFLNNAYFDIFVEYAQAEPDDILIKITAWNRADESAELHLIPQLTCRNTWSWFKESEKPKCSLPKKEKNTDSEDKVKIDHPDLGVYYFYTEDSDAFLFTDNETNRKRLFNEESQCGFFKDAFHEYIINNKRNTVNKNNQGTKFCSIYKQDIPKNEKYVVCLRLSKNILDKPFENFEDFFKKRKNETDDFYNTLQNGLSHEAKLVQRQAFAGLIWSKQYYKFDVSRWLDGDENQPAPPKKRKETRNKEWRHLYNDDIISMPDKWEYPWYAVWDSAFHCIPFALIDPDFAKRQLVLFTREWYMHPSGQIPAYEWNYGDVNPPVHAWATWRVYQMDRKQTGKGDREFLEKVFHKLMINFTWWVNRKDNEGLNIFQGGFLGLDNIGVFDRSKPLPTGGHINQADGTSWMAMYSLNLMRIALELAIENPVYEDIASKFFEHFLHIADAITNIGDCDIALWDDKDQFFYDELRLPDGKLIPLRVRSMVGIIPLFAVEVLDASFLKKFPGFKKRLDWFLNSRPELNRLVPQWNAPGKQGRHLFALISEDKMQPILNRLLDEAEFLSNYGIRSLSKYHKENPYVFECNDINVTVEYEPAESKSRLFGGNSNWRGPIWFPMNFLIIESLQKFHHYYGDEFKVECPKGSSNMLTLNEVADFLSQRLFKIFSSEFEPSKAKTSEKNRAVYGHRPRFNKDPHFRDFILFYEYFDGDTGRGVGASHQTGWTALIAKLLHPRTEIH